MDEKELAKTLMNQPLEQEVCKYCHLGVSSNDYFCPHCGKKLRDKPLSTGVRKQILVYFVSAVFSPLGVPWAIRYFKQGDQKSKIIAWVIIALTVVSLGINAWLVYDYTVGLSKQFNSDMNQDFAPIYNQ